MRWLPLLLLTACGPVTVSIPGADAAAETAALDAPADVVPLETGALEAAASDTQADGTGASLDAGSDTAADASPDAALPSCVASGTAACVDVGCRFAPATLRSCDPGEADLPVYGADFCERRATLLVLVAGWCGPCQAEAPMIEQYITQGYAMRGVRVISIVVQKPDRSAADATFCNTWRTTYGLHSTMAFDPRMATAPYFAGITLPASILVDRRGVIRHRVMGASAGIAATRAAIDEVLATP